MRLMPQIPARQSFIEVHRKILLKLRVENCMIYVCIDAYYKCMNSDYDSNLQ